MKGNYIGKKPSGYGIVAAKKTGIWEIYDQGQLTRDTQWTGQPWNANNGYYLNKKITIGLNETSPNDVQFNDDGTKFYVLGSGNDTVYQYSCSTAWDISTASYTDKSFLLSAQETNPTGLFFKSDGTKFYIVGETKDTVFQYSCSTAWDISTAFHDGIAFYIGQQEPSPKGLFFKSDGTKFYIVGNNVDRVFQYSCSTAWDVSTASYDSVSFVVSSQESSPTGLFFKSDGTKFYIVGTTTDSVHQYSCSTAWDVSTASYDSKFCNVLSVAATVQGVVFKSDGTKFYIVGDTNDQVCEYSCSTAWDVSTNNGAGATFYVGSQEISPNELVFKSDGTKFYIIGTGANSVLQYSCSTAWDVSTASYDSVSFSVSAQEGSPAGLAFKSDGTKFYVVGTNSDTVYQYSCSTAWDVSTASYDSVSFSVNAQESTPTGLFFKSDGTKFYIVGQINDTVYQYSCSTAWDVSTSSYDSVSFSVSAQESQPGVLFFKSDGTKFYIVGTGSDTVYQYSCSTAWDISTASYDNVSFNVNAQESSPTGLFFKSDGTRLYILGQSADTICQYNMNLAWDLGQAVLGIKSFSIRLQDTQPKDLFFKSDGTKFYTVEAANDRVFQYSCSTAWDVSTASYDSVSFKISAQESSPNGLFFKSDGTKFYIVGTTTDTVYQYSCSTAWDVSTASYDSVSFSVSAQDSFPFALFFKSDGTKFYILGSTNDRVYQYSCSTAWDVSTASYDSISFSVISQEISPTGLFFKSDGTKFYIVGNSSDKVHQYSCSTAWDVSTASYDSVSFNVSAQEAIPEGLFIDTSGYYVYICGSSNPQSIYQYSLV